jgi:hypothetical protein
MAVRVAVHQPAPDSTQAHWVDGEHQPTDLAVGGSNPSRRAKWPGRPPPALAGQGAEGSDCAGGVEAASVEPLVDRLLDAVAARPEGGRHRQGRSGHHEAGALGQQPAKANY